VNGALTIDIVTSLSNLELALGFEIRRQTIDVMHKLEIMINA
jgi:hypothetical protein